MDTWVRFFHEDDDNRSGEVKAKGIKLVAADRERDYCSFLCEVVNLSEAEKIHAEWNNYPDDINSSELRSSFAFTVSHPHGLAQRVSFGEIQATENRDVGGPVLKLLAHSCGDILGMKAEKVLFLYIEVICSEEWQDWWDRDLRAFLSKHRAEVVGHLLQSCVIIIPTEQETNIMHDKYDKLVNHCRSERDKTFKERFSVANFRPIDEKYEKLDIWCDVINELPHIIKYSSEFKHLEKSLIQEITNTYKKVYPGLEDLTEWSKHVQYNVTTCPGSSGAWVDGFQLCGSKVKYTAAVHHGGKGECNIARVGAGVTM